MRCSLKERVGVTLRETLQRASSRKQGVATGANGAAHKVLMLRDLWRASSCPPLMCACVNI